MNSTALEPRETTPTNVVAELLLFCFLFLVTLCNIYCFTRGINLIRAIISTRFFTKPPPKGGRILDDCEPDVTIQICCYNEQAVIEETINAACSVDWPKEKLFVQILDDSNDETSTIIERVARSWRLKGVNCERRSRRGRTGYKAGNLYNHTGGIVGDFVAVFDADHRCEEQFLRKAMPHFHREDGTVNDKIGLVQLPWAYYNTHQNLLTEFDALNLDVTHVIEQEGRAWAFRCFGFNGTGGIWRKSAILAAGGWQWDTVTEDLDIAYQAYMAGYEFVYLRHIPQMLEIPAGILAQKQQKQRWTKGFFQVARKSLGKILRSDRTSLLLKIEACFHMTAQIQYPAALLAMILIPLLDCYGVMTKNILNYSIFGRLPMRISALIVVYGKVAGSNGHYQSFLARTYRMGISMLSILYAFGMTVYESFAIWEGLTSNDATFHRTPKEGIINEKSAGIEQRRKAIRNEIVSNMVAASGGGNVRTKTNADLFRREIVPGVVGLVIGLYFAVFPFCYLYIFAKDSDVESIKGRDFKFLSFLLPSSGLILVHGNVLLAVLNRQRTPTTLHKVV